MNTIISFLILFYFMYLLYYMLIYFKDTKFKNKCKKKIQYMPIPEDIENEFNMKYF